MAYDPTKDDTKDGVSPAANATGTETPANARLRKINLNVDIVTQEELNEAVTVLSSAISSEDNAWKEADQQLSSDLKAWALGSELSGAIHNEITAEADARAQADQAIRDSLSAYEVSVSDAAEGDNDNLVYTITQGGETVGTIDIAKDQFVSAANFDGTVLVLHLRNGSTISTDLSGFVDVYTITGDALVEAGQDGNAMSVKASEALSAVVAKVQDTSATWDTVTNKADLTAVTEAINNLSSVYASKSSVEDAASALDDAISATSPDDYADIDQIITELEALKARVKTFAQSMMTA